MAVDLHLHSTASDGHLSPGELVRRAASMRLKAMALTDHDSVDGIAGAQEEGRLQGIEVIPAIEINTEEFGEDVHILGYFIDYQARWLCEIIVELRLKRENRILRIAAKLKEMGIHVDLAEVKEMASEGTVGRPHVASVLVKKGYVGSMAEAFSRYLAKGAPAFVSRQHIGPREAIEIIRRAGGISSLAHPVLIKEQQVISKLVEMGLDAIECWHADQDGLVASHYKSVARQYSLAVTGGSDFHGPSSNGRRQMGRPVVSDQVLKELKESWLVKRGG